MKQYFISNTNVSPTAAADQLARIYNSKGFMTRQERILNGRRLYINKAGVLRTATGLATKLHVDIVTSEDGLLISYKPARFK